MVWIIVNIVFFCKFLRKAFLNLISVDQFLNSDVFQIHFYCYLYCAVILRGLYRNLSRGREGSALTKSRGTSPKLATKFTKIELSDDFCLLFQ